MKNLEVPLPVDAVYKHAALGAHDAGVVLVVVQVTQHDVAEGAAAVRAAVGRPGLLYARDAEWR